MAGNQAYLDLIFVPAGLFLLLAYHAYLAYRISQSPTSTVIGVNLIHRQAWVSRMMQESVKNGVLSVQTLRNNIMASTLLATAAITLCSLIAFMEVGNSNAPYNRNSLVLGDKSSLTSSIKLMCVLVCFLIAFLCNVQSIRYYSHVSFLISIPLGDGVPALGVEYVSRAIRRGSYFWSIGLRAFYFSVPLFLWIFGPLPMFISSFVLVILLHSLDMVNDCNRGVETPEICRVNVAV